MGRIKSHSVSVPGWEDGLCFCKSPEGTQRKQNESVLGLYKCSLCTCTTSLPSPIRTKPQRHSMSDIEVGKQQRTEDNGNLTFQTILLLLLGEFRIEKSPQHGLP